MKDSGAKDSCGQNGNVNRNFRELGDAPNSQTVDGLNET